MSSHGSGKLNTGKSSSARRTTMSNSSKTGKEELHKKSANGERRGPRKDNLTSPIVIILAPLMLTKTKLYSRVRCARSGQSERFVSLRGPSLLRYTGRTH